MSLTASSTATLWSPSSPRSQKRSWANPASPRGGPTSRRRSSSTSRWGAPRPLKTGFRRCSTHEPFGSQGPCQASSGQFLNIFTWIGACSETIRTLQGTKIYKLCVYQECFLLEDIFNQLVDFVHNFPSHPWASSQGAASPSSWEPHWDILASIPYS